MTLLKRFKTFCKDYPFYTEDCLFTSFNEAFGLWPRKQNAKLFNEISELDLVVGEKVLISVEANYDFEYNSSPEIVVEEVTGVAKHYFVSATMAGEYKIIFTCQELVKVLDVIVKIK